MGDPGPDPLAVGQEPSCDALLGGRVRLLQPRRGYRVAIDPVLLAAAVAAATGASVLDVGSGTGAVALCLAARRPDLRVTGLERDPEAVDLAGRSAALNGFSPRVSFTLGDLADLPPTLRGTSFDHVVTNPPYQERGGWGGSPDSPLAGAHRESLPLALWLALAVRRLRPGGTVTLIQRADRLADVLAGLLAAGAGAVRVLPLWPSTDAPAASRILASAVKGSRAPASLRRGLVLHRPDGGYTSAAAAVLEHGHALDL